jgi:hypothetical protein
METPNKLVLSDLSTSARIFQFPFSLLKAKRSLISFFFTFCSFLAQPFWPPPSLENRLSFEDSKQTNKNLIKKLFAKVM